MKDQQLRRLASREYDRLVVDTETAGVLDDWVHEGRTSLASPGSRVRTTHRTPRLLTAALATASVVALVVVLFAFSSSDGDGEVTTVAPGAGTSVAEAPSTGDTRSTPQETPPSPGSAPPRPASSVPTASSASTPTTRPPAEAPLTELVGYDHVLGPVVFSAGGVAEQLFEDWVGDPRARIASGFEGDLYVEKSQGSCAPSIVRASSSGVESFLSDSIAPATETNVGLLAVIRTEPTPECFTATGLVTVVDGQATEVVTFDINAAGGGIPLVPVAVEFVGIDRLVVIANAVDDSPAAVPGRTVLLEYELTESGARFVNQINSELGELWQSMASIGATGQAVVASTRDEQSEVIRIDLSTGERSASVAVPGAMTAIVYDESSETWFASIEGPSAADDFLIHETRPLVTVAEGISGITSLL